MLNFKNFLLISEGVLYLKDEEKKLATEMFKTVMELSEPEFQKNNLMIFKSSVGKPWIKKDFGSIDLYVIASPFDSLYDLEADDFKVEDVVRGSFGYDKRFNNKPYIKMFLLSDFDPNSKIHNYVAKEYFSKNEIWQTLLHELTHLSDKGVQQTFKSKGSLAQKGGYLDSTAEFNAHFTNLVQSCDANTVKAFMRQPNLDRLPPCINNDQQLKDFVVFNLSDNEKKKNLLKKLALVDFSKLVSNPTTPSLKGMNQQIASPKATNKQIVSPATAKQQPVTPNKITNQPISKPSLLSRGLQKLKDKFSGWRSYLAS